MIDLNALANSLTDEDIIKLLEFLGNDEYINKEDCIIFKTICHNVDAADASFKLYYYKNNHLFVCYTECNEAFNIYGLFEKRYQLLNKPYNFYKDIVLKIAGGKEVKHLQDDFFHTYESDYDKYQLNTPKINYPCYDEKILNAYEYSSVPEWKEDGISEEVMKIFNIRYSIAKNKIIIPHYDIDNNLIGVRCRNMDSEDILVGKYMPMVIEGIQYNHSLSYNLYGLNLVKDNIKKFGFAIVAEGEKSAMQYMSMFGQDKAICVSCCGSILHRYQVELLIKSGADKILVAFDKEYQKWEEQQKYYNKLYNMCNRYKNICNIGFVFDTKNLLGYKDSPFDRGKETTMKLIEQGVWL